MFDFLDTFMLLLVPGTLYFWLFIGILILTSEREYFPTGGSIIFYLFCMSKIGYFTFLQTILDNIVWIIPCVIGYIFMGILWTIPKLWFYIRRNDKIKNKLMNNPNDMSALTKFLKSGDMTFKFYMWTMYWPINMPYTLIQDPIRIISEYTQHRLRKVYLAILVKFIQEENIKND